MAKKKKKKHKKKHRAELSELAPALLAPELAPGHVLPAEITPPPLPEKLTLRHLGGRAAATAEPMTGAEIRELRERAHISQAVFARYLNLTVGYVSQLERGAKRPSGPALVLLNLIRRKGIEALL
jgi:putative transcriptional regulator